MPSHSGPTVWYRANAKTLVDFGDQSGCDGMTVDEKGNIYLTPRGAKRPGVMIISPEGEEVGFIPTPSPAQGDAESRGEPAQQRRIRHR